MSDNEELCWLPATELSRRIAARELTPLDITEAVLDRIDRIDPDLNAYVYLRPDAARAEARQRTEEMAGGAKLGALHGIPYSVKEALHVEGTPITHGIVANRAMVADHDEPVAARLREAGGIFLGKTNLPEGGYCANSTNHLYGATHNPWQHGITAGGSSSGAGAAVAAGLGPIAHAADGGGSIRIPAAINGVVGFKPSLGRVPILAMPNRFLTFAFHGPIARTVGDAALMLNVMAGYDPADPLSLPTEEVDYLAACDRRIAGARIAWSPDLGIAEVDPEIRAICEQAVSAFTEIGCAVESAAPQWSDPARVMWEAVWTPTYSAMLDATDWDAQAGQVDEQFVEVMRAGERLTVRQVQRADAERGRMVDQFNAFMGDFDFLITPTTTMPSHPVHEFCPAPLREAPLREQLLGWLLTYPFNLVPAPAITVPAGFTSAGLPVGLQIVGRMRADADVLAAAAAFERLRPWAQHRPVLA
ncbi:amidase [Nocardia panacis]|uniref:amidase n=1 Tax=Nocardia panacis TaxID=2340916 RepID=A0A3A4K7L3_9NOCA|nr:amidase family protein [Nocardia panacis]RJO77149.1 amidase [Nocardia panacis]